MKEPLSRFFGWNRKEEGMVRSIPVDKIIPSPYQPRTHFADEQLEELCQTIQTHGLIQPIVVREKEKGFELIAGERRWRAVKKMGMSTIPAIIQHLTDHQAASISLVENLQREGLTVIEEAKAYRRLLDLQPITQDALAQRLGKKQSTIANKLRLLQLSDSVQKALMQRKITERHARSLLSLKTMEDQQSMLQEILAKELTVKQTEDRIRSLLQNEKRGKPKRVSYSRDWRLAVNTIRKSIHMVKQSGMKVSVNEQEKNDAYEWIIRIPK